MKVSIRQKEEQYKIGLIRREEYIEWMKEVHPNLTMGDWVDLCEVGDLKSRLVTADRTIVDKTKLIEELEIQRDSFQAEATEADEYSEGLADTVKELRNEIEEFKIRISIMREKIA